MHEHYMKLAIEAAKQGTGKTHTNPLVGAIIVHDDKVIATGAHLAYGQAHAERNALAACGTPEKLREATMYVTLEPCNHQGKQPPCTQAIIDSGIKRVVVGTSDPNPMVAGLGIKKLRQYGVEVIESVLPEEARALNPHYHHFFEQQRPYVVLKQAMTLDGKIAVANRRTAITGPEVYERVRQERGAYQAILVGSETVLIDDPELLATAPEFPPLRVIIDRRGRTLRQELALFKRATSPVLIFTEVAAYGDFPKHVEVTQVRQLSIEKVLAELAARNIQSLYVEGGAKMHDAFLASGAWDEVITYLAPKIIGGNATASMNSSRSETAVAELTNVTVEQLGADLRISGRRC